MKRLTRRFGGLTAVDGVTLTVPAGQILGYLGPNGAGKTTTVRMLTGTLKPSDGSAEVAGFDICIQSLEAKRRLGYVPESGALYQALTPFEYLQLIGRLHSMEDEEIKIRIEEIGGFLGIMDVLQKRMDEFSKGMKQKVVIASSLMHNPQVFFFDEPLNGLDANAALLFKKLLRSLADAGKTIFYCSHILDVVENLCDRVVIIDKGRVVADGSVGELKAMTKKSSLEAVFSKLTQSEDLGELARAFSKKIVGKRGGL